MFVHRTLFHRPSVGPPLALAHLFASEHSLTPPAGELHQWGSHAPKLQHTAPCSARSAVGRSRPPALWCISAYLQQRVGALPLDASHEADRPHCSAVPALLIVPVHARSTASRPWPAALPMNSVCRVPPPRMALARPVDSHAATCARRIHSRFDAAWHARRDGDWRTGQRRSRCAQVREALHAARARVICRGLVFFGAAGGAARVSLWKCALCGRRSAWR